jgi:hypothetical protein
MIWSTSGRPPEIIPYLKDADHVDVKTVEGTVTLREFAAAMLSYQPAWMTSLYVIRAGFVRALGLTVEEFVNSINSNDPCIEVP